MHSFLSYNHVTVSRRGFVPFEVSNALRTAAHLSNTGRNRLSSFAAYFPPRIRCARFRISCWSAVSNSTKSLSSPLRLGIRREPSKGRSHHRSFRWRVSGSNVHAERTRSTDKAPTAFAKTETTNPYRGGAESLAPEICARILHRLRPICLARRVSYFAETERSSRRVPFLAT
jgi:hypothetical protein